MRELTGSEQAYITENEKGLKELIRKKLYGYKILWPWNEDMVTSVYTMCAFSILKYDETKSNKKLHFVALKAIQMFIDQYPKEGRFRGGYISLKTSKTMTNSFSGIDDTTNMGSSPMEELEWKPGHWKPLSCLSTSSPSKTVEWAEIKDLIIKDIERIFYKDNITHRSTRKIVKGYLIPKCEGYEDISLTQFARENKISNTMAHKAIKNDDIRRIVKKYVCSNRNIVAN